MCGITKGRTEPCLDNFGGIDNIYLWSYVEYRRYEIEINDNKLISYPTTTIYKYELRADGNNFTDDLESNEDGISYNQNLSAVLKQIETDYFNTTNLLNKRVGCIIETRKGEFLIMGLYNGCRISNLNISSGGSRTDFNGINLSINARERKQSFFIDDLASAGFVVDNGETFNLLLQNGDNLILQNNDNLILQDG